jgi:hypothetical protein
MVAQKSPRPFLAKIHNFFDENNLSERHRSGVVQATFRHCSGVVQKTVQAGSTQRNISRLYFDTGHVGCLEKVARPEPFCAVLQISL